MRTKRFLAGLVSGYAMVGVNIVYTIASVPLALHYLSKEEFGMWALVTQITAYLMLLELGLSESVSRHLSDEKDVKGGQKYADTIRTGTWVFTLQGLLMVVIAVAITYPLCWLLRIPKDHVIEFNILLCSQTAVSALHLATRSHGAILWAHMRHDVINILGMAALALNLLVFWACLHFQLGIYSTVCGSLAAFIISIAITIGSNHYFQHYPQAGIKGRLNPEIFKQLFSFGGELFLINIGSQLANASRVVIVGRTLGLEAATVWSVATKAYSLAQTLTFRIFDSSAPALAEIQVAAINERLKRRYQQIFRFSFLIAAIAAMGIAIFNKPVLAIWTSGKIEWSIVNDILLGLLVISTTAGRCLTGLASIKKEIGNLKYACLFEGVSFIALAIPLTRYFGIQGLLIAAIGCNGIWIVGYGIHHIRKMSGMAQWLETWTAIRFMIAIAVVMTTSWAACLLPGDFSIQVDLLTRTCYVMVAAFFVWFLAIDQESNRELLMWIKRKS